MERVIIPVSGGGLIAGIAMALKSQNPFIEVIGVCAASGMQREGGIKGRG